MLYGYVRVSTDKQTVENQKLSVASYIQNKGRNNTYALSNRILIKFKQTQALK